MNPVVMPNSTRSTYGDSIAALILGSLLVILVLGCGGHPQGGAPSSSPTPHLAPSVAASSLSPETSSAFGSRIITVFLKNSATPKRRARLSAQIARMPEVQEFAFVSKNLALLQLKKQLGKNAATIFSELHGNNPLPASFRIVVKASSQVLQVAQRFYGNPLVDNDPGTHDGVSTSVNAW